MHLKPHSHKTRNFDMPQVSSGDGWGALIVPLPFVEQPRRPGFYWVRWADTWWVACWSQDSFWLPGSDIAVSEDLLQQIGSRVERD